MIDLLAQVTPLTKGLLWFTNGEVTNEKAYYKEIDYLLDGLLTATLKSTNASGNHVLIGQNFGNSFYVIAGCSISENEINSYLELIKTHLTDESNLLLIDENGFYAEIQKFMPAEIKTHIQVIQ